MRDSSSRLPAQYLQPAPVRGQLEPSNERSAKGWRYIQCTDTPNEFKVLLPPRTASLYEALLNSEVAELAKQPHLSWERILEIRHLKDRMIRKVQRISKVDPTRKPLAGMAFTPQTAVAPADFRLKEMEKWLKNNSLMPPRISNALTRKLSFESANPKKSYCCARCAHSGRPDYHTATKAVETVETHQRKVARRTSRQMSPTPTPRTPRGGDPTLPSTPPRRVSGSSIIDRRASLGEGRPTNVPFIIERRFSQEGGSPSGGAGGRTSPFAHSMLPGARSSRESLTLPPARVSRESFTLPGARASRESLQSDSDNFSNEDSRRFSSSTIIRSPRGPSNSKSPFRRLSASLGARPSSPLADIPNSPPPLPHLLRSSGIFGGPITDEPGAIQESSDDLRETSSSPNPLPDGTFPTLQRRRSCIKRQSSSADPKTVSWAPNHEVADEILRYAKAADELGKSDEQYEQIRSSYMGHLVGLDSLHFNVAQSLDRLRAETEHLEKLQDQIRDHREKLKVSCENLEQKHSQLQQKVHAVLQPSVPASAP